MYTVVLLTVSNVFMTTAWYWYLKPEYKEVALWKLVLISWGIAFVEYCFQVPANRIGSVSGQFTPAQLKTIQEIITLVVFAVFSILYLRQDFKWNYAVAFMLIIAAAYLMFKDYKPVVQ